MFRNYLNMALRTFWKEKGYSLINLFGLSVGLSAILFILLFIKEESSYNRFHPNVEQKYRLTETFRNGEELTTTALTPYKVAPLLAEMSPAVKSYCRIDNTARRVIFQYEEEKHEETSIAFADSNFFEFFAFPLLRGHPEEVLQEPYTMVIAEDKAELYFGETDPVGKTMQATTGFGGETFNVTITGVMAMMPSNSHFHYDLLLSMDTGEDLSPSKIDSWGWTSQYSYVELAKGHSSGEADAALETLLAAHAPDWFQQWAYFGIQPMQDIHLRSRLKDEMEANGDIAYLYIFSVIGLFILLVACINYINLATARAARRAKEVGVRKVAGAGRRQLVAQFLTESFLMAAAAFGLALILTDAGMPLFNNLTEKNLSMASLLVPGILPAIGGGLLVIGLLAGLYPAFVLASFRPVQVLKGVAARTGQRTLALRKGLVVFQFAISIALIIGVLVVYQQWQYLRHKNLGIDTEQVVLLPVRSQRMLQQYPLFKDRALQHSSIANITASSKDPLSVFTSYTTFTVDGVEGNLTLPGVAVDEDFFNVYEADILQGVGFNKKHIQDSTTRVIINEAAAKMLGRENPVGMTLRINDDLQPKVIGLVEDFHFESLYSKIRPMFFATDNQNYYNTISVVVQPDQIDAGLAHLEQTWEQMGLREAFSFQFMDEAIDRRYRAERRFLSIFMTFASLAIFIACLGIFGLSAYTVTQRTKEIGVRKVLGASGGQIAVLLSGDFLRLVGWAFLLASPAAYLAMSSWLERFAYQVNIHPALFLAAGLTALSIAVLAISYNAWRAARSNPVEALRYE
jgi:putative ABC transport system permease protein